VEREAIPIPADLADAHPFITATWRAAAAWHLTPDDRLQPDPEPGIVEVRVSRAQLLRALRLVQAVIDESRRHRLEIAAVARARGHRAGVGISRDDCFTPVRVEEMRDRIAFSDLDLDRWRREHPAWSIREDEPAVELVRAATPTLAISNQVHSPPTNAVMGSRRGRCVQETQATIRSAPGRPTD
jgi:hypothetical protein